jgi:hypothetical protein
MFRVEKPEVQKIDRVTKTKTAAASLAGISREISIVKEMGYEATMSGEMSYDELADGVKRKDAGTFLFIRVVGGFGIGLLAGIAAIGSFVVYRGDNSGWAMIITAAFFFSLFVLIILKQAGKRRWKSKESRIVYTACAD